MGTACTGIHRLPRWWVVDLTYLVVMGLMNDRTNLGMIEYIAQPVFVIQLGYYGAFVNGVQLRWGLLHTDIYRLNKSTLENPHSTELNGSKLGGWLGPGLDIGLPF
jgi:hypothetical protein